MSWSVFILACGVILAAFGGFLWYLGYNYSLSKRMVAERKAEVERMRADAKAREAEIFAGPVRSKPELLNVMRDKQ